MAASRVWIKISGDQTRSRTFGRDNSIEKTMKLFLLLAVTIVTGCAQPTPQPVPPQPARTSGPPDSAGWRASARIPGNAVKDSIGSPNDPGPFLYWYRGSAGAAIGPHRHTAAMHIKVLKGRKYILMGNPPERVPVRIVETGDTITIPAGMWHVEWWEEDTIEEITGVGPMHTERPPAVLPERKD